MELQQKTVANICNLLREQLNKFVLSEDPEITEKLTVFKQKKLELQINKTQVCQAINEASKKRDQLALVHQQKTEDLKKIKNEFETLDEKYKTLVEEYEHLEEKCMTLKSKINISDADRRILSSDKKILDFYNSSTNIVWDYSIPINSSTVTGCVRNKNVNYLQSFVFKTDEREREIEELLWDEIEKGLLCININDENVAINK